MASSVSLPPQPHVSHIQPQAQLNELARLAALDDTQEDNFADLDAQQHPLVLRMAQYAGSQGLGDNHEALLHVVQDIPESLFVSGNEHPTGLGLF